MISFPERDSALNKVIELAQLKSQWEKKIYGQFVAVLNAKKERIQALEEMLDLNINDEPHSSDGTYCPNAYSEKKQKTILCLAFMTEEYDFCF